MEVDNLGKTTTFETHVVGKQAKSKYVSSPIERRA